MTRLAVIHPAVLFAASFLFHAVLNFTVWAIGCKRGWK